MATKIKRPRVEWVQRSGNLDTRRLFPDTYVDTARQFAAEGITLPPGGYLRWYEKSDWWLLLSDFTVRVKMVDEPDVRVYSFQRGHITDFASVPPIARGLVNNTNLRILAAALVHDALFAGWLETYRNANRIFRQIIRQEGGNIILRWAAWLGVSSMVGRWLYVSRTAEQAKRDLRYFTFTTETGA